MSTSVWAGMALVGFGVVAGLWGYGRLSLYRLVAGTPTSRVADVDGPGRVELSGTAKSAGGRTVTAPLSGAEALVAGWRVEEWDDSGDDPNWREVGAGYRSVPFGLDDGSAAVAVHLGDDEASNTLGNADFGDLDHSVRVDDTTVDFRTLELVAQLAPDDSTPERIQEFETLSASVRPQHESTEGLLDVGNAHGERRYYEGRIEPGDEVYLLGDARPKRDADPSRLRPADAVVRPGDERFVLSGRDESALRASTRLGLVGVVGGAVLCLAGLLVALA